MFGIVANYVCLSNFQLCYSPSTYLQISVDLHNLLLTYMKQQLRIYNIIIATTPLARCLFVYARCHYQHYNLMYKHTNNYVTVGSTQGIMENNIVLANNIYLAPNSKYNNTQAQKYTNIKWTFDISFHYVHIEHRGLLMLREILNRVCFIR